LTTANEAKRNCVRATDRTSANQKCEKFWTLPDELQQRETKSAGSDTRYFRVIFTLTPVPVPAAVWLFDHGLSEVVGALLTAEKRRSELYFFGR